MTRKSPDELREELELGLLKAAGDIAARLDPDEQSGSDERRIANLCRAAALCRHGDSSLAEVLVMKKFVSWVMESDLDENQRNTLREFVQGYTDHLKAKMQ